MKLQIAKLLTCALALLFTMVAGAQSYAIKGVETFYSSGLKPIMNGKEVGGYVLFYKTDKADDKNDKYGFDLLDEKLVKVSSVKVVLPRYSSLISTVFNGEALGLLFYNSSKGNYIYKSYDKTLKVLGTNSAEKPHKWEKAGLQQYSDDAADGTYGIRAVPGKGFVRAGYGESKDAFKLTFYDHAFKQVWKYETPPKADGYEIFLLSDINEKYVTGMTMRRNGMFSHKLDYSLTVFEVATGKKIMDTPIEKTGENLSISATSLVEGADEIVVQGEYYDADDKPGVNKSKGFFLKKYDLNTGKESTVKMFSWAKDIEKLFDAKGKQSIEDKYQNYPQTFFTAANGHHYIVFEQYKKAVDGGGLAMKALGAGTSAVKIKVGNLWVFEADADYKPISVKYYEKDGSDVGLPSGAGMMGSGILGMYAKYQNGFDFQFLQQSADKSTFNVAYINYDREKGEKTKTIAGNIFLAKDGSINFDKVDLTAGKKTTLNLYPAKGTNVALSEYNSKEKTLALKLVKLNY